ncbi:hypothetical protein [Devosia sp.]|uniref:hypothetical protein n=1 Tax=Devosia sp. TaxID=1871048 RepID=UPI001ACE284D|nr:hypothetical protein [Devosia sp.]MBN9335355.1 hypothetical protein [Devosia sp.]
MALWLLTVDGVFRGDGVKVLSPTRIFVCDLNSETSVAAIRSALGSRSQFETVNRKNYERGRPNARRGGR